MIAPKNARKNPTMGQVDEAVRDASARQAHEAAGGAYQSPPPPPIFEHREPEVDRESSYREDPGFGATEAVAPNQPGPLALLARVREWPWYVWLGVGAVGLLVASVVQEERAAANPGNEDDDESDEDDFADDDDTDDESDEDEDEDDESDEDDLADDVEEIVRERDGSRKYAKARAGRSERVVEDDQPDQEPEESVLGDDE